MIAKLCCTRPCTFSFSVYIRHIWTLNELNDPITNNILVFFLLLPEKKCTNNNTKCPASFRSPYRRWFPSYHGRRHPFLAIKMHRRPAYLRTRPIAKMKGSQHNATYANSRRMPIWITQYVHTHNSDYIPFIILFRALHQLFVDIMAVVGVIHSIHWIVH